MRKPIIASPCSCLRVIVLAVFVTTPAFAGFTASGWLDSLSIAINTSNANGGANVIGNVLHFPLLIRLNASTFNFSQAKTGGADIRFAKADGITPLAYQIERWQTDSAEAWVLVDTVYGANASQSIKMFWGKAAATDSSSANSVFAPSNGFTGVYHADTLVTGELADATSNNYKAPRTSITATGHAGIVGLGQPFNGNADNSQANPSPQPTSAFTISYWQNCNDNATGNQWIWFNYDWAHSGLRVGFWNADLTLNVAHATETISNQLNVSGFLALGWQYYTIRWDSTGAITCLRNDTLKGSGAVSPGNVTYPSTTMTFGSWSANTSVRGTLDEFRVDGVVRSDDWVKLCYTTQLPGSSVVSWSGSCITPSFTTNLTTPVTKNVGQGVIFSVATGGTAPTYQWQRRPNPTAAWVLVGTSIPSYSIPSAAATDSGAQVRVKISNGCGSDSSIIATLIVNTPCTNVSIGAAGQPVADTTPEGTAATFKVTPSGTAPFTYQWQVALPSAPGTFNPIAGATSQSYTIPAPTVANDNGKLYRVAVSNLCPSTANSNPPVALTVTSVCQAANIVTNPQSHSVVVNIPDSFSVAATGTALTYQWLKNNVNIPAPAGTANPYKFTPVLTDNGATFACKVQATTCGALKTTPTCTLTVVNPGDPFNPVVVRGAFVDPTHVRLTLSAFNSAQVNTDSSDIFKTFARSVVVWYQGSGYPPSPALAQPHFTFAINPLKAIGTSVDTLVTVPVLPVSSDSNYYFVGSIDWKMPGRASDSIPPFVNANGCSAFMYGNQATAKPVLIPLPSPTYNRRPTFTWRALSTPVTRYTIEADTTRSFTTAIISVPVSDTFYVCLADLPLRTIYWRVRADNSSYSTTGVFDVVDLRIPLLIPYMPKLTNERRPTLQWHSVTGASAYTLTIASIGSFATTIATNTISDTSASLTSDLPFGSIFWKVKSDLLPTWSIADSFFIQPDTIPFLLRYNGEHVSMRRPMFKWRSVNSASSYKMVIADNPGFTNAMTIPTSDTFYIPTVDFDFSVWYWKVSGSRNLSLFSVPDSLFVDPPGSIRHQNQLVMSPGIHVSRNHNGVVVSSFGKEYEYFTVAILGTSGRQVANFEVRNANSSFVWNYSDCLGKRVHSGLYLMSITAGNKTIKERVIVGR